VQVEANCTPLLGGVDEKANGRLSEHILESVAANYIITITAMPVPQSTSTPINSVR
jgi:hypothetical protein